MRYNSQTLGILMTLLLAGCETVSTPTGPRSVLRPESVAVINTLTSTGTGALTGMLMNKSSGPAVGAVSGAAGSIVSQTVQAFLPTRQSVMRQAQQGSYPQQGTYQQQRIYTQQSAYPQQQRTYPQQQRGYAQQGVYPQQQQQQYQRPQVQTGTQTDYDPAKYFQPTPNQ